MKTTLFLFAVTVYISLINTTAALSEVLSTTTWNLDDSPSFGDGDFQLWLDHIELGCKQQGIPANKWADVGVKHLNGELRAVMEHRTALMTVQTGQSEWDWADFRQDLVRICEQADRLTSSSAVKSASELEQKSSENRLSSILDSIAKAAKPALKSASELEHKFSGNRLSSILDSIANAAKPALKSAAHLVEDFTAEHITPVAQDAGEAIAKFYGDTVVPGVNGAVDVAEKISSEVLSPAAKDARNALGKFHDEKVPSAIKDVERFITEKIYPALKEIGHDVQKFAVEHPYITAAAGVGLIVAGSLILFPAAGLSLLEALGFSSTGPVPGTIAALVQSKVYGAFTTGVFSVLQSYTMTATPVPAASLFAAAIAVGAGFWLTSIPGHDFNAYMDGMKSSENVIRSLYDLKLEL